MTVKTFEAEVAEKLMGTLEFVSYDGVFPNLCSGTLVVSARGKTWTFGDESLSSEGSVSFDLEGDKPVRSGPWRVIEFPRGFPKDLKEEVVDLVNAEVERGCCGGCI